MGNQAKVSCQDCGLSGLCLPAGLSKTEIVALDDIVKHHTTLVKGEHLFETNTLFSNIYAVKTGSLKTYVITEDGSEQIMGFYFPGELIGLDAFQKNMHNCTAVSLETTSLCALPIETLNTTGQSVPNLQHTLYRCMGHEIAQDQSVLLTLAKHHADERLAAFLLNLSQRFQLRGFSATEFNLSMARHDIANYLGLAVETVSRVFSKFQESGLLTVRRKYIKIHDLARLKTIVGR